MILNSLPSRRIGTPNALLCPAPPFEKPVTSAGELRAARQAEDAGRKALGAGLGFAAFGDVVTVTIRTQDWNQYHGSSAE